MKRRHTALFAMIWLMRLCGVLVVVVAVVNTAKYAGWIDANYSGMNSIDAVTSFAFSAVPGLILLGLSSLLKLQVANYDTSRATAIMLRRLLEEQRPGQSTRAQSPNGMWDEESPKGILWRPKYRRSKEFGGFDRWEPQDLTEIRLRRGLDGHRPLD